MSLLVTQFQDQKILPGKNFEKYVIPIGKISILKNTSIFGSILNLDINTSFSKQSLCKV
jgi:hypothetical protein